MRPERLDILIVGAYGGQNLGDDALMLASLSIGQEMASKENIAVLCSEHSYVPALAPGVAVIPYEAQSQSLTGKLLLYGGGTQFYSFPRTRRKVFRSIVRAAVSPHRAWQYAIRKFRGHKWAFSKRAGIGLGVGPFVPGSSEQEKAKAILSNLDFLAVRDRASYQTCKGWDCHKVMLGSDLCFLPELWGFNPSAGGRSRSTNKRIGIVIRDWPHTFEGAAFKEPLLDQASKLRSSGFEVVFISFCPPADAEWISAITSNGKYALLKWCPTLDSPAAFVRKLGDFDVVITARYHGAVFAALLGKPVICVEVEQKLRLAAETLDSADCLWQQPFKPSQLASILDTVYLDYERMSLKIRLAAERQRLLAKTMKERFRAFVNEVAERQ